MACMGGWWWQGHQTSSAPDGFQRAAFQDISVGDVVWYEALHQSRTGMIHRAPVQGRIISIWPTVSRLLRRTSAVTLEMEVDDGRQRRLLMSRRDVVYVKLASASEVANDHAAGDHAAVAESQDLPDPVQHISEHASE
jgi:hypothetical protein